MGLERLFAEWREHYVIRSDDAETDESLTVFERLLASDEPDSVTHILWRGEECFAVLNAFPYGSGHLMVLPQRAVGSLEELTPAESAELWQGVLYAVTAVTAAYDPGGINVGMNLGRAAGAGLPGHLHVHVLPRWSGDTNFMTSVAETRVLPESLDTSWAKLTEAWPAP